MEPVERSFYAPLLSLLDSFGFIGGQEIKSERGEYIDIIFEYEGIRFILEVKLGVDLGGIIKGIVQCYKYSRDYDTNNIIVIDYPRSVKKIDCLGEINKVAIDKSCKCVILTDYWYEYKENISPGELIAQLKHKLESQLSSTSNIDSASKILKMSIRDLSKAISKHYKKSDPIDLFNILTKDFSLFRSLSETKKSHDSQLVNLLAYILVNQLLFYYLYSKERPGELEELKEIDVIFDLDKYFDQIRAIDFRPIFDMDVIRKIPTDKEALEIINNIIKCLPPLRIKEMKQDLYGRLIGESLPEETRKVLASYYTKVNSADLLTKLAIKKFDETVCDIACGSGTLLVTAYKRKMELYKKQKLLSNSDKERLHRLFLEKHLTGVDIMPFACHLSGLNLSAQNLQVKTDSIRITNRNSLDFFDDLPLPILVCEAYDSITDTVEKFPSRRQKTLGDFNKDRYERNVEPPKIFEINKTNTILINPPFTSINKLPKEYHKNYIDSINISKICGKRINLWGYFIVLADKLLSNAGTLGAIIPNSFARGNDTKLLRTYLLDNYSVDYIIVPPKGSSFSEAANFGDIIIILRKIIPENDQRTKIVNLKNPIEANTQTDINTIASNLEVVIEDMEDNDDYTLRSISQKELRDNIENLMPFISSINLKNKAQFDKLREKLTSSKKMVTLDGELIKDGFQSLRPKNMSKKILITRAYSPSRTLRANFRFDDDKDSNVLVYYDKNNNRFEKDKADLTKSFRTITGINRYNIDNLYDYIIGCPRAPPENTHLVVANRLRLDSKETFLLAVYSNEKIKPVNAFFMYLVAEEEAQIICLFIQSTFYLSQFVRFAKQSTMGYKEIKQIDLKQMLFPDCNNLSNKDKTDLLKYFHDHESDTLSCIKVQLIRREKKELDKLWAKILKIPISEKELDVLYDSLVEELS